MRIYEAARKRIFEIIKGTEAAYGVSIDAETAQDYPAVVNDLALAKHARALLKDDAEILPPQSIGEDFSLYQREIPGLFRPPGIGDAPPLHSSSFDFDESALLYGVQADYLLLFG